MMESLTPKTTLTTSTTLWNYTWSWNWENVVFAVTLTEGTKKWFSFIPARLVTSWQQLNTSFLQHFQGTRKTTISLAYLGNVKLKKGENLKLYINCFNEISNFVTWSSDARILAHLTNGVLPETPFWDELQ